MAYVPTYLTCVPRQFDGWPAGITDEGKKWAIKQANNLLLDDAGVELSTLAYALFSCVPRPLEFNGSTLDYQYAVADRAFRACDAKMIWVKR